MKKIFVPLLILFFVNQNLHKLNAEEINIGIVLGFSGPAEKIVKNMSLSADLAFNEALSSGSFIKNKKLKKLKVDTKCNKSNIGEVSNKLLQEEIVAILGAACPGISESILLNVANKKNIPIISSAASSSTLTMIDDQKLFFRTIPSNRRDAEVLADITKDRGVKSLAITYLDTSYNKEFEINFIRALKKNGIRITINIPHEPNKKDYSDEASLMATAGGDAAAIISEAELGGKEILQALIDSGVYKKFVFSDRMIDYEILKNIDNELDSSFGLILGSNSKNLNIFYKTAKKNKIDPSSPFVSETYDAASILLLALQKINHNPGMSLSDGIMSVSNSPGIKIYVGELKKGLKLIQKGRKINYEGVTNIELDSNGETYGSFLEKEIRKGKLKTKKQR